MLNTMETDISQEPNNFSSQVSINNKIQQLPFNFPVELQKHFPVWLSDIYTLDDAYVMMREISRITNHELEGQKIIQEIKTSFSRLSVVNCDWSTCAYFIWRKPYMVAAKNTFID